MTMIKDTAEAVMQLLKILLTLLMNQVQTQVEEQGEQMVPSEHAQQIQNLMQEVQSQKTMLQEIAKNLRPSAKTSTSPGHRVTEWIDIEEREIHIWEDEMQMLNERAKMTSSNSPTRQVVIPQIPTSPVHRKPSQAAPAGASGARSHLAETPSRVRNLAHAGVAGENSRHRTDETSPGLKMQ